MNHLPDPTFPKDEPRQALQHGAPGLRTLVLLTHEVAESAASPLPTLARPTGA